MSKAPAIARAAAILRLLSESDVPLGVQAIARELDLIPSTCLHILRALVGENLVSFDAKTKRYALDVGVLTLAQKLLSRNRFSNLVQPILDRMSREYNLTMVGLRIISAEHSVVVAVSQWDPNLRLSTEVGSAFPAFAGATGRCLAAFGDYSDEDIKDRFETLEWQNPPAYEEWRKQVDQTRQSGVSIDRGEYISGVTVVLAPIFDLGSKLSYALIAFGIGNSMIEAKLNTLCDEVRTEAEALSAQLSGETKV